MATAQMAKLSCLNTDHTWSM